MDELNILIATCSRAKHKILCGQLKHLPHREVHVRRGDEALNIAQVERFHVALIQAQLPGISGIEVCKRLADFSWDARLAPSLSSYRHLTPDSSAERWGHGRSSRCRFRIFS